MRPLLVLLALLAAPTALAQKPADDKPDERAAAVSPFIGTWEYIVRPDDPFAQGTFTIAPADDGLSGTFMTDAPRAIDPFDATADPIVFTFKQPGMGTITVRGTLTGDDFAGEAQPEGQGPVPFVATRQLEAASAVATVDVDGDGGADAPTADVAGRWSYTITPPGGDPMAGTFSLEVGPDGMTGTIVTDAPRSLRGIEVTGRRLAFEFDQPGMGTVLFRGTVQGDAFEGEVKPGMRPAAPVTAQRLPADAAADSD